MIKGADKLHYDAAAQAQVWRQDVEGSLGAGGLAARAGGAGVKVGAIRVTFWGALAMAVTAGVGALFGTVA